MIARITIALALIHLAACGSSTGSDPNPTGAAGAGGGGGQCLATGTDCTATPNACCSGICFNKVGDPAHHAACAAACTQDADCLSGCCTMLVGTAVKSCAPRGFCIETCMAPGTACLTTDDCCAGNTCVTPSNTCAANCTSNAECVSGCCALLQGGAGAVCSNPIYCQ